MMGFMGKTPMQGKADSYRGNRAGQGGSRAAMMRSMMGAGAGGAGAGPVPPPPPPVLPPPPEQEGIGPIFPQEPPIMPGGGMVPPLSFGGGVPSHVKPRPQPVRWY